MGQHHSLGGLREGPQAPLNSIFVNRVPACVLDGVEGYVGSGLQCCAQTHHE